MSRVPGYVIALRILLCGVCTAEAAPAAPPQALDAPASSAIQMHGRAPEPVGAYRLCFNQPSQCRSKAARGLATDNGRVILDAVLWDQIRQVNRAVNAAIRPVRDGETDLWTVGARSGDCEDFALAKRAGLLKAGFPTSAVLMATARTQSGDRHAVLVVRTDRGDYVLDNLAGDVTPWTAAGLRLEFIQSPIDPRRWHQVS